MESVAQALPQTIGEYFLFVPTIDVGKFAYKFMADVVTTLLALNISCEIMTPVLKQEYAKKFIKIDNIKHQ